MAFTTKFEATNRIAKITLIGKLDTPSTPLFKIEMDKALGLKVKRLVLLVQDLDYMASSALRVLIAFKNSLGQNVEIFIISPQPIIREILEMTGVHFGVSILSDYDAQKIDQSL